MRNYILYLNFVAIADYFTRGRAQNAFDRMMRRYNGADLIELVELKTGRVIASSI